LDFAGFGFTDISRVGDYFILVIILSSHFRSRFYRSSCGYRPRQQIVRTSFFAQQTVFGGIFYQHIIGSGFTDSARFRFSAAPLGINSHAK
jgi:hypothetical protein